MGSFSLDELMVIEASRYIEDHDVVFSGTGLPLVSTMFAQKTHAPHLCYVVETGPIAPLVLPTLRAPQPATRAHGPRPLC